jgi:hypothetical protein
MIKNIIFLVALLAIFGCDSDPADSNEMLSGDIAGKLILLDSADNVLTNRSGATVRIEGTTYSTATDSTGAWRLKNVAPGTYVLVLEKEGFGPKKLFNVQHVGNGTLYLAITGIPNYQTFRLKALPKSSIDLVLRSFEPYPYYRDTSWQDSLGILRHGYIIDTLENGAATFTVTTPAFYGTNVKGVIWISHDENIDPENGNSYVARYRNASIRTDQYGYDMQLSRTTLYDLGFTPGERVFIRGGLTLYTSTDAADGNYYEGYGYYDFSKQEFIYSGISNNYSEVKSFILP